MYNIKYCNYYVQLFDCLRKKCPEALEKLVPVAGDLTLPDLGLSSADKKILQDNVSIVIHSAAIVKFNENLDIAVDLNVLGTRRVLDICRKMPRIAVNTVQIVCSIS